MLWMAVVSQVFVLIGKHYPEYVTDGLRYSQQQTAAGNGRQPYPIPQTPPFNENDPEWSDGEKAIVKYLWPLDHKVGKGGARRS